MFRGRAFSRNFTVYVLPIFIIIAVNIKCLIKDLLPLSMKVNVSHVCPLSLRSFFFFFKQWCQGLKSTMFWHHIMFVPCLLLLGINLITQRSQQRVFGLLWFCQLFIHCCSQLTSSYLPSKYIFRRKGKPVKAHYFRKQKKNTGTFFLFLCLLCIDSLSMEVHAAGLSV